MNPKITGYLILTSALGMLFVSMAPDVKTLHNWSEFWTPGFIGTLIGHVGAVIASYIGGRITPIERDPNQKTRASDNEPRP